MLVLWVLKNGTVMYYSLVLCTETVCVLSNVNIVTIVHKYSKKINFI